MNLRIKELELELREIRIMAHNNEFEEQDYPEEPSPRKKKRRERSAHRSPRRRHAERQPSWRPRERPRVEDEEEKKGAEKEGDGIANYQVQRSDAKRIDYESIAL